MNRRRTDQLCPTKTPQKVAQGDWAREIERRALAPLQLGMAGQGDAGAAGQPPAPPPLPRRGRHALGPGTDTRVGEAYVILWFPAPDAVFASDAVTDADPAVEAITTARAEHFVQTYISARRNMALSRKAAIEKKMAAAPNTLSASRDALARSISKVSYRFWGARGNFLSVCS